MSHLTRILGHAADERGAVLVVFAVFAPVAILFAAFAIDAGNFYLHKRHLQLQADSGALSAALAFQPCSNAAIESVAKQYSGVEGNPLYNPQVGGTTSANIHEMINSKLYYNQPSPVDTTVEEKPPCEANMVDVKLTETNLPWYWEPFAAIAHVDAHARVEILEETTAAGVEPLAVAETAPVAAEAYFVDEDNKNAVLAKTALTKTEVNAEGDDVWSNVAVPLEVTINHPHIGVVVALSGNKSNIACGQEYVECFGRKAATEKASLEAAEPVLHVAGYSAAGTGTAEKPVAREVTLTPATCADGYFSDSAANCTFAVSAKVEWGALNKEGQKTPKLEAEVAGKKTELKPEVGTDTWQGTATLPTGTGSNEVNLLYECKKETGSPCQTATTKATFKDVHRIYAASEERSGTLVGASLGAVGGLPRDADSFQESSTPQKLAVTIDVGGSLGDAAAYSDPLRKLRWEGSQGVRVGCPPPSGPSGSQYRERLEKGCPGTYTINTKDPLCTANKEPYDCLTAGLPGKDTGPTKQGIDGRIETDTATRHFYCENNWKNNNGGGVPIIPNNDSRIVQVFIMPYGAINSEGAAVLASGEVPIQDFAAFYVTGFPGDSCASDPATGDAEVVGHFIKYVNVIAKEGGEKPKCREDPLGECVAILTR